MHTNAAAEATIQKALAKITEAARARDAAKARIDADPRIIARRAELAALPLAQSGIAVFSQMANGSIAKRALLARLIRARRELIEGFPHHARQHIRETVAIRRQSFAVIHASPDMVVLEQRFSAAVNLGEAVEAASL